MSPFSEMERRTRKMDKRPIGLPALLVWLFILALFAAACWLFFVTATNPEPYYK